MLPTQTASAGCVPGAPCEHHSRHSFPALRRCSPSPVKAEGPLEESLHSATKTFCCLSVVLSASMYICTYVGIYDKNLPQVPNILKALGFYKQGITHSSLATWTLWENYLFLVGSLAVSERGFMTFCVGSLL